MVRRVAKDAIHILDWYHAKEKIYNCGAIESANKYAIQDRLKKFGMRWSVPGASAVAKLRTLYLSGLWDDQWRAA
jgi:hypothetical protein